MDLSDTGNQIRLFKAIPPPLQKFIITTMTNFQDMAAYPDRVLMPVVINEYISYPDSLAKNTAAFFSISLSSFSFRFSSRSRFNSSNSSDWCPLPGKAFCGTLSCFRRHLPNMLPRIPRFLAASAFVYPYFTTRSTASLLNSAVYVLLFLSVNWTPLFLHFTRLFLRCPFY